MLRNKNLLSLFYLKIVSFVVEIVLLFLFFFIVTPIGALKRIFNFSEGTKYSYWVKREKQPGDMKRLF